MRYLKFIICAILFIVFSDGCKKQSEEVNSNVQDSLKKQNYTKFVYSTEKLKRYRFPTHINDIIVDRAFADFSEVFMVIIEPDKAPPFHKHDDTEQIFYIIEGKGVLTIGEKKEKFNVKPGDVVRIPVSTFHSIRADGNNNMKYLCVDCFGAKPRLEPTWEAHVKTLCKDNGWDFNKVVSNE